MHFFQKNYSSFYFLHLTDTLLLWIIQDPSSDPTVHHHHLKTHTHTHTHIQQWSHWIH